MKPLRILLIEDSERDAARLALELRRAGYGPEITRVETLPGLREELERGGFDLVISDYMLPGFNAPEALALFREKNVDVPFVVVSGAVGEDIAVEVMKSGAHDYVAKDRMVRLVPAIERELAEAGERRERRKLQTLFQSVLRASPYPSAVVRRDSGGIVHFSDSFRRVAGEKTLVPGQPLLDVVDFAHPERVAQVLNRGGTAPYVVYSVEGQNRVANVRVHTVEHHGTTYANVVIEDVTEQHYLKTAFDAVSDAVLIVGSSQTLLYANRAAERLWEPLYFGMDVQPFLAASGLAVPHSEPRLTIAGETYEVRAVPFRFAGEDESSTILTFRNVSQEEELLALSTHDPLTGIYNVRFFDEALRGGNGGATLAIVDLDRFKPINDELGHSAGDAALIRFASVIRRELRPSDVFARLGGDEFGILFPATSVDEATSVVARIYEALERNPFHYDGRAVRLSASCGIGALVPPVEETKKRVDAALYAAKNAGRGRWVVSGR